MNGSRGVFRKVLKVSVARMHDRHTVTKDKKDGQPSVDDDVDWHDVVVAVRDDGDISLYEASRKDLERLS